MTAHTLNSLLFVLIFFVVPLGAAVACAVTHDFAGEQPEDSEVHGDE